MQVSDIKKNNKSILSPLNYSIVFLFLILITQLLRNLHSVSDWKATHWLFSYTYGFAKRSFVGTLTKLIFGEISYTKEFINLASLFILIILSFLLLILIYRVIKVQNSLSSFMIVSIFLVSPGTIAFFALDLGRFDQINYCILIVCLLILLKNSSYLAYASIGFLCFIAILIHETFIVIHFPLILSAIIFKVALSEKKEIKRRTLSYSLMIILPFLAAVILIITLGHPINLSPEEYTESLELNANFPLDNDSVGVLYNSLKKSISLSIPKLLSVTGVGIIFSSLIGVAASLFVIFILWFRAYKTYLNFLVNKAVLFIVFLSSFSVIVLYFLGHDYGRWMACFTMNNYILFFWIYIYGSKTNQILNLKHKNLWYFCIFCLIYSSALGALEIERGIALIEDAMQTVLNYIGLKI